MKTTWQVAKKFYWVVLFLLFTFTPINWAVAQTCVQPPDGLVSHWPLDGDASDIKNGNDGTSLGGTYELGKVGQALQLSALGHGIIVPNIGIPEAFTIEAWISPKGEAFNHPGAGPIAEFFNSVSFFQYPSWLDLHVALRDTTGPIQTETASGGISPLAWNHAALTYVRSTGIACLYANGEETGCFSFDVNLVPSADFYIGRRAPGSYDQAGATYNGLIDEVAIYNRALSLSEIQAIFNAGSAGKCKPEANQPPVALCKNVTVTAGAFCTASASIDNGSYDPDDADSITLTQSPAGPYSKGETSVTLTATDSNGASSQCTGTVTVFDVTPPTITAASVNPSVLWPPDHKMFDVTVNYNVSDNCTQTPVCSLSVTSNEPIDGLGDGDTSPDWVIIDSPHVQVRAEREGTGMGRIYTITITCFDGEGKSSSQNVTVSVPKHQVGEMITF